MKRYDLTIEAQHDLQDIADYIRTESSAKRAVQVITQIRAAFRKLAKHPGLGHYREDLLDEHHRFWSVYSYMIAYRWDTKPVCILAVVHGARDLPNFFTHRAPPKL